MITKPRTRAPPNTIAIRAPRPGSRRWMGRAGGGTSDRLCRRCRVALEAGRVNGGVGAGGAARRLPARAALAAAARVETDGPAIPEEIAGRWGDRHPRAP